jgi:iron complex outermembrane recepter protein
MKTKFAALCSAVALVPLHRSFSAETPSTNNVNVLPPVTVTGHPEVSSLTSPGIESSEEQKRQVPGGYTVRDTRDVRGRTSSFQDLLGGVPGLTLQTENGMELTKVSIRGSSLLSEDEPLGVIFLLDGFPFNQGDGEVILEDFSIASIKSAEVYRGANAFKYGAITLGGAINLVSKTGYDSGPFQMGVSGGSYGYVRGEASGGGVEGPVDFYGSATARLRNGFRDHSYEDTEDFFSNFGYKFDDHAENRFYISVTRTDRLLPGGITKEQMDADPRQVDPESLEQDLNKQWYYLRLADKVSFVTDNEQADAGIYWWHRNLLERGLFNEDDTDGIQGYYSDNFGTILNSTTRGHLFGHDNTLTVGMTPTLEIEHDADFQNNSGQKGELTGKDAEQSINLPFYAEDQQYVTEKLSLLAGIQAIYVRRDLRDYFTDTDSGDQSDNLSFTAINPKIGTLYEIDRRSQLYANFSRSWQPPSFDNMLDFDDDNPPPPFGTGSLVFTPLSPQHAWTAEFGTRGEEGRFGWELSLYHSWVHDELLDVNTADGVDRGAVNIARSIHQGIEAGLEIELLNSLFTPHGKSGDTDRLTLSQTYTFNDFHFDGDPVYGNNRIAGIPIHFYQAELTYESPCGFYAGPNLQWNVTHYPVDHANTLSADPYALLGFKMGMEFKNGVSIFFDARNLTGEHYASSVDPIPDARTADGPIEIFHPGDGRSFYGGVSWRF